MYLLFYYQEANEFAMNNIVQTQSSETPMNSAFDMSTVKNEMNITNQ